MTTVAKIRVTTQGKHNVVQIYNLSTKTTTKQTSVKTRLKMEQ